MVTTLVNLTKNRSMTETHGQVRILNELTKLFEFLQSPKKGNGLTPPLFSLSLKFVLGKVDWSGVVCKSVQTLVYANSARAA